MMGLAEIKAANAAECERQRKAKQAEMPAINGDTPDKLVASTAKLAMNRLDVWLREADRALVGRQIVRTRGVLEGAVCTITDIAIANGASGYHLLLAAKVRDGVEQTWIADLDARYKANRELLELGVTCELLAEDDTPATGGVA